MVQLASFLADLVSKMGYFGLFFLMAGESALMPIPSEIVLPFAGFLVFSGQMSFWLAVSIAVIGQLSGSIISYSAGYYGGRPFVLTYGRYFLLNKKHFEHVEKWFQKHGAITVFIGRLLPIIRTIISFPAGIAKMNFRKFLFYSTLGVIPWTIFLVYVGVTLGEKWQAIIAAFDKFQLVVVIGILALMGWWIWKIRNEAKTNT